MAKGEIPREVYGTRINTYNELWAHTVKRIDDAQVKSKGNYEDFAKKMVTRLKRITHEDKLHYAIAVLQYKGFDELVDIYEGKVLINEMLRYNF